MSHMKEGWVYMYFQQILSYHLEIGYLDLEI